MPEAVESVGEAAKATPPAAPSPAEEREDTPSPQTVPESTVQDHCKALIPDEKKIYDQKFLLSLQFSTACIHKPEGLPNISDVALDRVHTPTVQSVNKTPLWRLELNRTNIGPDLTPAIANLGRWTARERGLYRFWSRPRCSGQSGSHKEQKIVLSGLSLNDDVQLNKAENAWRRGGATDSDDPESVKTHKLLRRVQAILNKLTPQRFKSLMKQVMNMAIDTEERLKGVIELVFEKTLSEPNFSVCYAKMCHCLRGLNVSSTDKPDVMLNFRMLLLKRCQKEFEKDKYDDEIFKKKQKELEEATEEKVIERLKEELEEVKGVARRRSLGNIKVIGELFKLKMLSENIMHDCVVKLMKNYNEESLECLCRLLSTIGKAMDMQKSKPHMDLYFNLMEIIIKERKASSRIRFMLQDIIDLRRDNWMPRRGDQGPKTIEQIHNDAENEERLEWVKIQQQLLSKKEMRGGGHRVGEGGGMTLGPCGVGPASHRCSQSSDDRWNRVLISTKKCPFNINHLNKIPKPEAVDCNNQLLAPVGKRSWCSSGNGGSRVKASDDVRREPVSMSPPVLSKHSLSLEELEKKSISIIEEYLHINDMKEALQCVNELNSASLHYVFVRTGISLTLERSSIAREHMGLLLHQLIKTGTLSEQQFYKGLMEILEVAEDKAIDVPFIWNYLAELITPVLREGGIPMGPLIRKVSTPLLPIGKVGDLVAHILLINDSSEGRKSSLRKAGPK